MSIVVERLGLGDAMQASIFDGIYAPHWSLEASALLVGARDVRSRCDVWVVSVGMEVRAYLPVWLYPTRRHCPELDQRDGASRPHDSSAPVAVCGSRQQMCGSIATGYLSTDDGEMRPIVRELAHSIREFYPCEVQFPYIPAFQAEMLAGMTSEVARPDVLYEMVNSGSEDLYLSSISRSRRSVIRRDMRDVQSKQLRIEATELKSLRVEDIDMISRIKYKHGVPEPPTLTMNRLKSWQQSVRQPVAWRVVSVDGGTVAVAYGCVREQALEVCEVGVNWSHPDGHLAYVGAMIHGPLGTAWANGVPRIHLGYKAGKPKTLRGAEPRPVVHLRLT